MIRIIEYFPAYGWIDYQVQVVGGQILSPN